MSDDFDMAMGVDEARNDDLSRTSISRAPRVFAHRSDDAVAHDRDVASDKFAGDEIEDPSPLEHDVGLGEPLALLDRALQIGDGVAHDGLLIECTWNMIDCIPPIKRPRTSSAAAAHLGTGEREGFTRAQNRRLVRRCSRPILSIQSHVVYGHVGNSAAVFPLQRLGREVWPLMSVQFSSHAGYPGWRGRAFDAGMIDDCLAGLEAIGVLPRCVGLMTGYLGRPEIGEAALRALGGRPRGQSGRGLRVRSGDRRRRPRLLCRAGRRRILPRPRPSRCDDRHAERFRARMAGGRARKRRSPKRSAADRRASRTGPWGRRRDLDVARQHAARTGSTCSPATAKACGGSERRSCRSQSTARATCSPRFSFIIGWSAARRRRRCRGRRRRSSASSPRRWRRAPASSRLVATQKELVAPSTAFIAEAV